MNMQNMLKQAQKMQAQMTQTQEEIAASVVEGTAGGGKVQVTATGTGDILSIKVAKEVIDPEDAELLEDLLLSGVKQAQAAAKALAEEKMRKVTAGLPMPPGFGF